MTAGDRVLVVGAEGLIGAALMATLGERAVGTTRRQSPGLRRLDLADPSNRQIDGKFDVVFLCAAITSHARCVLDPAQAYEVNVRAPFALARNLIRQGTHVVFLSTDSVFGESNRARGEDNAVCPGQHAYPFTKAEAERVLLEGVNDDGCADKLAIVRLTKVISVKRDPIRGWMDSLRAGESIAPLTDLILAPISVKFVIRALLAIARGRCAGVLHLSAERDVSYAELAAGIASRLDMAERVSGVSAREAGVRPVYWPQFSRLDMTRTSAATGLRPLPLDAALDDLLAEEKALEASTQDRICAIEA